MAAQQLTQIIEGDLCSGCGLCASILGPERARMAFDKAGFLRPQVSGRVSAAEDKLIADVCPGNNLDSHEDDRPRHGVWGPILELHTGHATDDDIRFRASSGGALSAIVGQMIASGQADYALHIGADDATPWLNALGESHDREAVGGRAGSRYAPSAPLADLVQRLDRPERFVVVGKPCDIAGLRQYARHDPRVGEKIVAMISFMCGGVPGRQGIEALLAAMGVTPQEVASFRYRGHGWPGEATAVLKDGRSASISYAKSWGGVLSRHVQPRCKICPDGAGHFADIVCADAWYGDARGYPVFEERDGRSLVIARTTQGSAILAGAKAAGALALEALPVTELDKMQPFQARRTQLTLSRIAALAVLRQRYPRYRGFHLMEAARQVSLPLQVRNFLGMARRVVTGRR